MNFLHFPRIEIKLPDHILLFGKENLIFDDVDKEKMENKFLSKSTTSLAINLISISWLC